MEKLIQELYKIFESSHINIVSIQEALENYKSNSADWKKYAHFDPYKLIFVKKLNL